MDTFESFQLSQFNNLTGHFKSGHHLVRSIPSSRSANSESESAGEIEYCEACFTNHTERDVDLFWIGENGVSQKFARIERGGKYKKLALLTQHFVAKDSETEQAKSFYYQSVSAAVFEGLQFGVGHNTVPKVTIFDG